MVEIKDVLNLLGNELRDSSAEATRFRQFIEKENWSTEQIKKWIEECVTNNSGAHDPYNRAFQDLIVSLGKRIGFEIEYGCYSGKSGEINNDGIWKKENGDRIILEVKTSTWPIGSVAQLGDYIEKLSKTESGNIFGLYIIGKGDIQPLTEQIIGSKYKDTMRLILYEDLLEILDLKDELEPVIDEKRAIEKVQSLLIPVESINIGNIVRLILEIATAKSTDIGDGAIDGGIEIKGDEPWTKAELILYLKSVTPYQRLLLGALVQADIEPVKSKTVTYLMNKIAKLRPAENIEKEVTGRHIAGAKSGLTKGRKTQGKEDIIESSWSPQERDYIYKIKDDYKQTVMEWVKEENLWIHEELN